jgi:hypothetical protein
LPSDDRCVACRIGSSVCSEAKRTAALRKVVQQQHATGFRVEGWSLLARCTVVLVLTLRQAMPPLTKSWVTCSCCPSSTICLQRRMRRRLWHVI